MAHRLGVLSTSGLVGLVVVGRGAALGAWGAAVRAVLGVAASLYFCISFILDSALGLARPCPAWVLGCAGAIDGPGVSESGSRDWAFEGDDLQHQSLPKH